jgi:hypothetical protein
MARWSRRWSGRGDGSGCWTRAASLRPELAEAARVGLSYISRILRLGLLAPDIVERAMDGQATAGLARLLEPFPVEWETQREQLLTR